MKQTYSNFEVIIVDDCSTDDTYEKILEISKSDSRIKCYRQEINKGAAEARNRGLTESTGQFVAFLDSDDLWENNKLEVQLEDMIKNDVAFSFSTYDFVDENGQMIKKSIKIKRVAKYKTLLTKTMISTPTVIIDREKCGDVFMPSRRTGQDYAFWLLLLRNCDAYGINQTLVHIRKRPGSLSKSKLQNIKDVWEVQTKLENINRIKAMINVVRYCFYAFKKRYLR